MQPGSSSANRRRQDWQRWTWDLRQSAPRSIHESHTPASPRHVTECNIRRVRSHVRLWPILGARFVTADGHRGRFGRGFPAKTQPSLPRQAQLRVTSPPWRPSRRVTRPTGAAGQMCAFGEPALRTLLPAGGCLANPRSAPGRAWRAVFDTAAPGAGHRVLRRPWAAWSSKHSWTPLWRPPWQAGPRSRHRRVPQGARSTRWSG